MAKGYLIDTSAVIKYLNGTFPNKGLELLDKILDKESIVSFITEIELKVWSPTNPLDIEIYLQFILGSTILGIEESIIKETVRIRKSYKLKLPDALIAATAMVYKLTLVADNDKDFLKIPSLKYLNPKTLK
ncbi:type II toxin-antitoxin system VapC family toxin [Sphingobacterium pedocola]|uniref:PIN domain nuclease n=1 Tax=Sphingobacterium pedocola TaxID=2082722 RepID=A0ABR9T1X4_9SPHI|nr:type II toxin-antitoxin system VapC family toxin [Sphingobacterium pedocola]MBE8719342.1 PIN domain nuclease [Sphingobacterium pedocola]